MIGMVWDVGRDGGLSVRQVTNGLDQAVGNTRNVPSTHTRSEVLKL